MADEISNYIDQEVLSFFQSPLPTLPLADLGTMVRGLFSSSLGTETSTYQKLPESYTLREARSLGSG